MASSKLLLDVTLSSLTLATAMVFPLRDGDKDGPTGSYCILADPGLPVGTDGLQAVSARPRRGRTGPHGLGAPSPRPGSRSRASPATRTGTSGVRCGRPPGRS